MVFTVRVNRVLTLWPHYCRFIILNIRIIRILKFVPMNRVYPYVFAIFLLMANAPRLAIAQCNCSAGVPATPITYLDSFAPTNASSMNLSFPQFNPAIGTLSCLSVWDTASGITTTSALNKDLFDSVVYEFQLTLSSQLKGPAGGGINITHSYNKIYGPDTLAPLGEPGRGRRSSRARTSPRES